MTPGALFEGDKARFYEQRTRRVVTGFDLFHDLAARAMAENAPAGARVLCLGAGTGNEILAIQKLRSDLAFLAVDISPEMVAQGRERCSEAEFLIGTIAEVDPDARFDAATAHLVFHFMDDALFQTTLAELSQRLKPNAPLVYGQMEGPDDPLYRQLWESEGREHNPPEIAAIAYQSIRESTALRDAEAIDAAFAHAGFHRPVRFFRGGHFVGGFTRKVAAPGTIPA